MCICVTIDTSKLLNLQIDKIICDNNERFLLRIIRGHKHNADFHQMMAVHVGLYNVIDAWEEYRKMDLKCVDLN